MHGLPCFNYSLLLPLNAQIYDLIPLVINNLSRISHFSQESVRQEETLVFLLIGTLLKAGCYSVVLLYYLHANHLSPRSANGIYLCLEITVQDPTATANFWENL
jgi:hypothetical protein